MPMLPPWLSSSPERSSTTGRTRLSIMISGAEWCGHSEPSQACRGLTEGRLSRSLSAMVSLPNQGRVGADQALPSSDGPSFVRLANRTFLAAREVRSAQAGWNPAAAGHLSCIAFVGGVKAGGTPRVSPPSSYSPQRRRPLDFNTKAPRKGHGRVMGEKVRPSRSALPRHRGHARVLALCFSPLAISMGMGK